MEDRIYQNFTAGELKDLTARALASKNRPMLARLKAEALHRVQIHKVQGTATPQLITIASKLEKIS